MPVRTQNESEYQKQYYVDHVDEKKKYRESNKEKEREEYDKAYKQQKKEQIKDYNERHTII